MAQNREQYIIELVDKGVGKGLKDVMNQVNKVRKDVDKLNGSVGAKGKGGLAGSLGGLSSIIRGVGLAGLGYSAIQAGRNIVKLTTNMEQTRIAFGTFLGSASEANKLIDELNEFSNVTPFDNQTVLNSAKTLLSFGAGVDEARESMSFLGDISAGTGKNLRELAVIFGQIRGLGRLQGQDLLQLVNAGYNPLQAISERTGKSMATLKDEMSKGLISFDMVKQAFIDSTSEGGRFFNMMEKQSKSLGGRFSTFMGKLQLLMIKIGDALAPALKAITEIGIKIVDSNGILGDFATVVATLTGAWAAYKIATIAATVAQTGLNIAMLANPVGIIVAGIVALVGGIILLIRNIDGVIAKFREWGGVFEFIADELQWLKDTWTAIVNAFKADGILGGLKRIGVAVLEYMLRPFESVLSIVARFDNSLGNFAKNALKKIKEFTRGLKNDEENAQTVARQEAERKKWEGIDASTANYDSFLKNPITGKNMSPKTTNSTSKVSGGLSEVKAGAPKNFNISINSLIKEQNFETVKDTTQIKDIIRTEVSRLLLGVVNDVQTS